MARTAFTILALALLCASAYAADSPADKISPAAGAAAGALGAAVAPALSKVIPADSAAVAASNVLLAGQSAHAATSAAGKLVGGLLTKSLDAHRNAGRLLVEVVNAINSLNIAGLNVAAGVTNTALSALVGKIRTEALAIGNIYTELLGEFGRFVGGSITAVQTLKRGVFVSPLALGVNHLEASLSNLITFLQAAVSPSVAPPAAAALFAPHLATLRAVQALLTALSKAIQGPSGNIISAVDGAVQAAGSVLGNAPGGAGDVAGLLSTALNLLGKIPGL